MCSKLAIAIWIFSFSCLVACSDREDPAILSNGKVAVHFAAGISTRIIGTSWEAGDDIGVTMLNANTMLVKGETFNRQYRASVSGMITAFLPDMPVETIYYPTDSSTVDFIAYYPYLNEISSLQRLPVSIVGQTDRKSIDLLVAQVAGVGKDTPEISLDFHHQWVDLEFNIFPGDAGGVDNLTDAVMIIKDMPVTATYNIYTRELVSSEEKDVNVWMTSAGTEGKAIVFPRKPGNEVRFEIKLKNGVCYTAYLSADSWWEQGTRYTYNITLRKKPVPVDVSVSITDWVDNEGPENGNLEL